MEPSNTRSGSASTASSVVRKYFHAFQSQDRKTVEDMLSDDFTFTSPRDDHIGKQAYFERCWPNSRKFRSFNLEKVFEHGSEAFVRYECEPREGAKFRNTEYFRIEGAKIKEVDVYFGRNID
jgi:ketosteroid isomerase-like protein